MMLKSLIQCSCTAKPRIKGTHELTATCSCSTAELSELAPQVSREQYSCQPGRRIAASCAQEAALQVPLSCRGVPSVAAGPHATLICIKFRQRWARPRAIPSGAVRTHQPAQCLRPPRRAADATPAGHPRCGACHAISMFSRRRRPTHTGHRRRRSRWQRAWRHLGCPACSAGKACPARVRTRRRALPRSRANDPCEGPVLAANAREGPPSQPPGHSVKLLPCCVPRLTRTHACARYKAAHARAAARAHRPARM